MLEKRLPDSAAGNETFGALQSAAAELLNHAMTHLKPDLQAVMAAAMEKGAELIVQLRVPSSQVEVLLDVRGTQLTLFKIRPPLDS